MCTICASFRPFDPDCVYVNLPVALAEVSEIPSAPNSTATSNSMSVGDSFIGNLESLGDDDWVAINLSAGTEYEISILGEGAGVGTLSDSYLRVYSASGSQIAENDDGGIYRDSRLIFTPTSDGVYYLSVRAYADAEIGTYQLTVDPYSSSITEGTLDELAAFLTDGYWNGNGASRHTFDTTSSNTIRVNITALDDRGQFLARAAMEAWEAVADVRFQEVTSGEQITFIDTDSGAYASYSSLGPYTTSSVVNVSSDWLDSYGSGYDDYSFSTYIHEIGHALGLGHQGPYNGSANYPYDAAFTNDSYQLSVMSYFSQTDNTDVSASYALQVSAMAADIIAIQELYGAPDSSSATAGDTTYGVGQTIGGYLGDLFDILTTGADPNNRYDNGPLALTIYDHSGIDTVDFSNDTNDQRVDLSSLGIWDVFGLTGNVVIARDTIIENYVAGSGNDSITGNGVQNILSGGGGNDTLNAVGGNGNVVRGGLGNDELNGGWGSDVLQGNGGADSFFGGTGADDIYIDGDDVYFNGGGGYDRLIVVDAGGVSASLFDTEIERAIGGNGNDSFNGTGVATSLVMSGEDGADTLIGGESVDQISGGMGNDVLEGGGGNDFLFGDGGSDEFHGGDGNDQFFAESTDLSFTGGLGYDRLFIQDNGAFYFTLSGTGVERVNSGGGHDVLDASGAIDDLVLSGAEGNDSLIGGDGNDVLAGGEGEDTLEGSVGFDSLFGNGGSDIFVFNDGSGTDFLVGWEDGLDRMDFSGHTQVGGMDDLTITDNGTNTRIDFAGGDAVVVLGYTGGFEGADFIF